MSPEQLEELLAGDDEPATNDRVDYSLRNPAAADLRTVTGLRDEVHDLDERYDSAPSTSLLARTGHCLGQVAFLRANASNHRVRHELLAVEAEAATLMGQLVWDASQRRDHATAHDYFDQAITAAQRLRDPTAEGRALLRKSFVALYGERAPETGLQLTMRTTEVVAGSSHVLAGLALLHTAEAYAMLGRQRDCERALRDADSRIERIGEADAALNLFSPTQPGRLAGSCYLFLGKPKLAQPILETTAHQLRDRSKSQAIVLGNLALAYLRQRRLDEAVGALHRAVDVVEATRGGGGLNVVFNACRELRPWRNVDLVQDVYDRVMTLMTA